jgi:hypothetical protein
MRTSALILRNIAISFLVVVRLLADAAEKPAPLGALGRMPVKEITVFKDGHCFVVQEGAVATDASGNVLLDQLPSPVIGTFWPYSAEQNARLSGVLASQRRVTVPRTALTLRELLEANVGAEAIITEANGKLYFATIVGFPVRNSEELARTSPPNSPEMLPEKGNLVLLRTAEGTRPLAVERITDVTFRNDIKTKAESEEFRNLLTLNLDWGGRPAGEKANVGLIYLQKGVRWIPSYKVELDGKGKAIVKLQATILNELTDLVNADVNLVIGVPSFAFKETLDPVALQQTAAQLSQFFNNPNNAGRTSLIAQNFDNSIMTQQARMGEYRRPEAAGVADQPGGDMPEGTKAEDLFVFSLKRITLKKGERLVVPVTEYSLNYRDVFSLELPFAPPPEVRGSLNSGQQQELARLFNAPKVTHKIRLTNKSAQPLTTAPALIFRAGQVLSQGMMTYTAPGAESDLSLTTAVDISVKKSDVEVERTPNALRHNSTSFARIDLTGTIKLINHRGEPAQIEVTRHVLGSVTEATPKGDIEKLNVFENGEYLGKSDYPVWWHWYGWPSWWHHVNGMSRITWKTTLEAGQSEEFTYRWNYFWN